MTVYIFSFPIFFLFISNHQTQKPSPLASLPWFLTIVIRSCFCLPEADLFHQKYLPMQDFTSYLQECLTQNHVLGKLSRCNSHIQVQLQSEFFWEETKSNSWDNLNLYLLRKVTAFWIVSLLQWWFSSSSTTYITWGALHSQWRFLGANRPPEAKMSGWRLWICILRGKKKAY